MHAALLPTVPPVADLALCSSTSGRRVLLSYRNCQTDSLRVGYFLSPRKHLTPVMPERHVLGRREPHFG